MHPDALADRVINIVVTSDGRFALPRDAAIVAADPIFEANRPKGTLQIAIALGPILTNPVEFHYRDLILAVRRMNHLVERRAGLLNWAGHRVKDMSFKCDSAPGCSLTIHRAAGDRTYRPDAAGIIILKLDEKLEFEDSRVTASRRFAEIEADL